MTLATRQSPLQTYDEAAAFLGIQRSSVKQLVSRGHLHSVPAVEDRRRRMLLRSELEAYAQTHAGKWTYSAPATPQSIWPEQPALPPELVTAGLASGAAASALIAAFRTRPDAVIKAAIIAALIALALLLFLEWRRQGKLNADQQRHLEKLAKQAEVAPERFLDELESLLSV